VEALEVACESCFCFPFHLEGSNYGSSSSPPSNSTWGTERKLKVVRLVMKDTLEEKRYDENNSPTVCRGASTNENFKLPTVSKESDDGDAGMTDVQGASRVEERSGLCTQ
jgi:hypothetical protein